ncbi:MAG: RNA 3'-phosphate cyclase [Methanospirillum sp.]|nr:RNA 3'-phosphate cyclase [Methanospirillum sp.]
MLHLDGAHLEGGGQLVRTAVALAAVTGEEVTVERLRAGRETPGLRPQHLAAVRAVAGCCGARVDGLAVGSDRLIFRPGPLRETHGRVEVGTAGAVPLVLQAWLPVALAAGGSITVAGGTEVPLGPTVDYADRVLFSFLRAHGARISLELRNRGYAPRGGGEVSVAVSPGTLAPLDPENVPVVPGAISAAANLPAHVPARQLAAAREVLEPVTGPLGEAVVDLRGGGVSTGSSITCWAGPKGTSALGRRGLPAERVGRAAARALLGEVLLPGQVDARLADQLLVYLARYGGVFTATGCTRHAGTVSWLLGEFGLPVSHGPGDGGGVLFSG